MSLEGLEWNTFENLVQKWNKVFNDITLDTECVENSLIHQ